MPNCFQFLKQDIGFVHRVTILLNFYNVTLMVPSVTLLNPGVCFYNVQFYKVFLGPKNNSKTVKTNWMFSVKLKPKFKTYHDSHKETFFRFVWTNFAFFLLNQIRFFKALNSLLLYLLNGRVPNYPRENFVENRRIDAGRSQFLKSVG